MSEIKKPRVCTWHTCQKPAITIYLCAEHQKIQDLLKTIPTPAKGAA